MTNLDLSSEKNSSLSKTLLGILALVSALIAIAFASIWLVVAETELTPLTAIFYRLMGAGMTLTIWQGCQRVWGNSFTPKYNRATLTLLFMAAACFSLSLVLLGWSLTQTSVANGTLLYNNMPVFTALFAWLFLGQRFSLKFWFGLVIALAGVIAIGLSDLQLANVDVKGDLAAIFASMLAATSLLCFEKLRQSLTSGLIMLWVSWVGSILLLPLVLLQGEQIIPEFLQTWLALLSLAVISQGIGQGLLTYCIGLFSAGLVAVCMLSIPVIAALASAILFGEQLPLENWLAFAVVLLGIYFALTAKQKVS
ncbi:MAG: DMT family transporter [Halothece sp. Uz-M2-17]|nr:DMT family transporter [Halothece sp. Uz-M2-17]